MERNSRSAAVVSQFVKGFLYVCQDGRVERQTSVMDVASLGGDFLPMFPLPPQLARARGEGWKTPVIHGRLFSSIHLKKIIQVQ